MTEVASLVPVDHRVTSVRKYEAGPPPGLELVEPGETVATTKEEEWVSKKKTEVTNTKQIETRVKRQVVLEDGKVVEDTGPMVTTNTTEDSETHEHHQTELRKLGDEDEQEKQKALEGKKEEVEEEGKWVAVPNPEGIVREVKERRVLSREETEEVKETEDVQHLGDITDEEFLAAVHSGRQDLRPILRGDSGGRAVVSTGPRLIHESSRTNKVTDTEDTRELSSVLPDGRIVTETQRTTEHEELKDEDLPDDAPERDEHKESFQRFLKTREQQDVDYIADGVNVGHEMRFKTENMEVERRGEGGEDFLDWDSLSARARRRQMQRPQRHPAPILPQQTPLDRKDALTKKPLNFDAEEETRKTETSKWLEHHFGSDSRSSNNSVDDLTEQPPKTSFFNVTIKSTPVKVYGSPQRVYTPTSPEMEVNHARYYQGISEWSERRKETQSPIDYRQSPPTYRSTPSTERFRETPHSRETPPLRDTTPTPPQRKRASERRQRVSQDSNRYDSGYRTPSRNDCREEQPLEEPPPDYSSPTPPPERVEKRQQRTRFAADTKEKKEKGGNIIGQSIRKLVGKIRSASAERKAKQRAKRSPSPSYQKGHVIDNHINQPMEQPRPPRSPVHRYYLGEDPFGGSIYGRENKYDGVKPAGRSSRRPPREEESARSQSTLGRFSKSTGRLPSRSSQTLPRHLPQHEPPTRLERNERSNSTINVSIINTVATPPPPIVNGGPPKPARTYRSNLSRSKSLNVHAADMDPQRPSVHKSNPHLHRLDENPIGLKSPALISSLSRSQRDLNEINRTEHQYTSRFGKNGYGDGNGYVPSATSTTRPTTLIPNSYDTTDSKKVFLKTLKDRAPELFKTLHETEEDSWRSPYTKRYDPYEPPTRLRESPGVGALRRGSNSSGDYSETFRTTSRNDDPLRPSVTNTVQTFSKKTLPGRDGRGLETIESTETKSVTKSSARYRGDEGYRRGYENGVRASPVVIELRGSNYRK